MSDELYMRRCLDLASMAWPDCRPNPMVGAVLVCEGEIISEGYTRAYGGAHAEVDCLRSVIDPELLGRSTLYVSLEPCSHHGRTPPCADLILNKGIRRLVVGCSDPNPEVAGKGVARLRAAGVEVKEGVLEEECRHLNRRFMTFHEKRRPYVVLKWAETADGHVDSRMSPEDPPLKITGALDDQISHYRRSQEMAILVGGETWRKDAPRLDVRYVHGPDPQRIVWTTKEDLPNGVMRTSAEDVGGVLDELYQKGIQSVLVEGGARVLQQFLDSGEYDEVCVLKGEMTVGRGVKAPVRHS